MEKAHRERKIYLYIEEADELCDFSKEALERCKQGIELIAETLGLEGFSRIDAFVHVETGEVPLDPENYFAFY